MKQATLQDILAYFHADYSDLELAEIVGLSQPSINNIRNGKQSGIRKIEHFKPLIEEYEKQTGTHFNMPQSNDTPPMHTKRKPHKAKPANEITEEIIEDTETSDFSVLPLLIGGVLIAGIVGYAVIQTRTKKSKPDNNQPQNETPNQQQSEGSNQHE